MTPRATDWSLALLVAFLFVTGVVTLFTGDPGGVWVFSAHAIGGAALAVVAAVKLARVRPRLTRRARWDRRTVAGLVATFAVVAALASGFAWAMGGDLSVAGYNLLNWHMVIGTALAVTVLAHAILRAKPIRGRDLAHRRQFVAAAGAGALAVAVWQLQRPAAALLGWRGSERRFTGSYEAGSFTGNDFPATSWVADEPRSIAGADYRLRVEGLVARPLELAVADLAAGDELEATLDCTGGFYSTQSWRGVRLDRLLERAGASPGHTHVRVVSHTGYRWSFAASEASKLVLATHVGDEPLSHAHGAPLRLVAPGRRGFQWIKWVVRLEVRDEPDPGALASTVWSSFTPEGRGTA